jgi:hypothetical protein
MIAHNSFEKKHDLYLGRSEQRFDLIIMRDPFNLFASRLQFQSKGKSLNMLSVYSSCYSLPELWIAYAKECLEETSYLKYNKLFVNYNRWFLDINYRQYLANKLSIELSDPDYHEVPTAGGGSSFDQVNYDGEAYKMNVMNRWKLFINDNLYRKLLNTKELLRYSNKLFGHIPGTEIFFD